MASGSAVNYIAVERATGIWQGDNQAVGQYLSIKYSECLVDAGIDLSNGTVGDAYDNALAECVIGLFKTAEAEEAFYANMNTLDRVA